MRGVFFTLDGLRSSPIEIPFKIREIGLGMTPIRRACMPQVTNVCYSESISNKPTIKLREYEFSKFVDGFDGEPLAYFCERGVTND